MDTCCLAWKCLERTPGGWGTWESLLHLSIRGKREECSQVVVAAAVADGGPHGGELTDQTVGLLPLHLG